MKTADGNVATKKYTARRDNGWVAFRTRDSQPPQFTTNFVGTCNFYDTHCHPNIINN